MADQAKTAFISRDPRITEAFESWKHDTREWRKTVKNWSRELDGDPTLPTRDYYSHSATPLHSGGFVAFANVENRLVPAGWKVVPMHTRSSGTQQVIKPNLRTKLGKQYDLYIRNELRMPACFQDRIPGMPSHVPDYEDDRTQFGTTLYRFPNLAQALTEHPDAWVCGWACEVKDSSVDPAIWQRIRLSEYHTILEMIDAQKKERKDDPGPVDSEE